ncbi:MAG: leucine-rich repeat domain-containing protein [Bacteroidaceae bacterium]|nr:leucine-rich repeat domain-containing protein [Bacteroidaceae bacterium]
MKKFIKKILLVVLVTLFANCSYAHDFEVDGIYYKYISKTNLTVAVSYKDSFSSSVDEYSGDVNIPSNVVYGGKTYLVLSIGDHAFEYCSDLTSVSIPNSVTSIGSFAFRNCSGLTSVFIPGGVTSIGSSAFVRCSGLTSVSIPAGVTAIGSSAFSGCIGLTSVDIPSSVMFIGSNAFVICI